MKMAYPYSPGTGAGRPAEPAKQPETTTDAAKPSEGAANPSGYQGHSRQYDDSSASDGRLDPGFRKYSKTLGVALERDRKEREALANEALGIDPEMQKARTDRARIAALTQSGEISEARAAELWRNLHPHLSPEDV